VRGLRRLRGQRLVVEGARRVRVEGEVELVLPAELEAGLGESIVPVPGAGMPLGDVGGSARVAIAPTSPWAGTVRAGRRTATGGRA
jgi:hypothetical protein